MSTATTSSQTEAIDAIDALLTENPFGDTTYITDQMHVAFTRRIGKLAPHLAGAGELRDALTGTDADQRHRVLGDTVVRCAVQHAFRQVETGEPYGIPLPLCDEILSTTAGQMAAGAFGPLGSRLVTRIGPAKHLGWIWSAERPEDAFTEAFRHVVMDNYGELPCTPEPVEVEMMRSAVGLLDELVPATSRSALNHTQLVVVFPSSVWGTRSSSSEYRLSGSVFLSQRLLSNVWWAAEHLYHEALHQQMYDFRQAHSLLTPGFDREHSPTVCSLWNMPDSTQNNLWDVYRSVAAFHVYVHLALLATVAEERKADVEARHGPITMTTRRTALGRAHYLGEQLTELFWAELGPAGHRFVDWFGVVLRTIDSNPPPAGAFLHLLLDRYWREAKEVAFLSTQDGGTDISEEVLLRLASDELGGARRALAVIGDSDTTAQLNNWVTSLLDEQQGTFCPGETPALQFARLRRVIMETVTNASPDGFVLSDDREPDEIVRDMIEQSSEQVRQLVGR